MSEHLDIALSRLKNMLTRTSTKGADVDDLCARHAELTSDIRKPNPLEDPDQAQRDEQLRRSRADLEQEMSAIMLANIRA